MITAQLELPGKEASNSILSFLELSRKLKQDAFDAYLEEVVGNAAEVLEEDPEAVVVLEAFSELIYQLDAKRMLLRNSTSSKQQIYAIVFNSYT